MSSSLAFGELLGTISCAFGALAPWSGVGGADPSRGRGLRRSSAPRTPRRAQPRGWGSQKMSSAGPRAENSAVRVPAASPTKVP
jgi:hypothetical protein